MAISENWGLSQDPSVFEAITIASSSVPVTFFFELSRTLLTTGFQNFLRPVSVEKSPCRSRRAEVGDNGEASTLMERPMFNLLEQGGLVWGQADRETFNDVKNG
jgi:transposase